MTLYIYKIQETPAMAKASMDAQMMHRFLTGLVGTDRKSANLLYKLDLDHQILFVQSDIKPAECTDLELLHEIDVASLLDRKEEGQKVRFMLTTDLYRRERGTGVYRYIKRGYNDWLKDKLRRNGIGDIKLRETGKRDVSFSHKKEKGGSASFTGHDYIVEGTIEDKEAFLNVWRKGMGKHKAYGNGLFMMMR